jgi:hypothetical protein
VDAGVKSSGGQECPAAEYMLVNGAKLDKVPGGQVIVSSDDDYLYITAKADKGINKAHLFVGCEPKAGAPGNYGLEITGGGKKSIDIKVALKDLPKCNTKDLNDCSARGGYIISLHLDVVGTGSATATAVGGADIKWDAKGKVESVKYATGQSWFTAIKYCLQCCVDKDNLDAAILEAQAKIDDPCFVTDELKKIVAEAKALVTCTQSKIDAMVFEIFAAIACCEKICVDECKPACPEGQECVDGKCVPVCYEWKKITFNANTGSADGTPMKNWQMYTPYKENTPIPIYAGNPDPKSTGDRDASKIAGYVTFVPTGEKVNNVEQVTIVVKLNDGWEVTLDKNNPYKFFRRG